jgi:hypothetical protein
MVAVVPSGDIDLSGALWPELPCAPRTKVCNI